MSEMEAPIN